MKNLYTIIARIQHVNSVKFFEKLGIELTDTSGPFKSL